MIRVGRGSLGVVLGLVVALGLGAAEARACTLFSRVQLFPARAAGPQPRNSGVLGVSTSFGPASFLAFDDAGKPVALQVTALQAPLGPDGLYLIRDATSPAAGSKRIYRGAPSGGTPAPAEVTVEYSEEMDATAPSLEGPIRLWVGRNQSVGACPGPPEYVAGVLLPVASERGFVSIVETDRDGGNGQPLVDVFVRPDEYAAEARLGISGEPGRTVCLAFKTTDLAGNTTPLGAPCCVDEKNISGPCEQVTAPASIWGPPEPEPGDAGSGTADAAPDAGNGGTAARGGGGCSVAQQAAPGGAWAITAALIALAAGLRSRAARPGRCPGPRRWTRDPPRFRRPAGHPPGRTPASPLGTSAAAVLSSGGLPEWAAGLELGARRRQGNLVLGLEGRSERARLSQRGPVALSGWRTTAAFTTCFEPGSLGLCTVARAGVLEVRGRGPAGPVRCAEPWRRPEGAWAGAWARRWERWRFTEN